MNDEGIYNCTFCGEEIIVPIDRSAGTKPKYVEECPKCSHSNVVQVKVDGGGYAQVWVKENSHEHQKVMQAISGESLSFGAIELS